MPAKKGAQGPGKRSQALAKLKPRVSQKQGGKDHGVPMHQDCPESRKERAGRGRAADQNNPVPLGLQGGDTDRARGWSSVR